MKKKSLILIGVGIIVVLAAALLVILILNGSEKKQEVIKNPYQGLGEIVYVKYTYNNGPVELVKKKGKWSWKDDKNLYVDQEGIDYGISGIDEFAIIDFMENVENLDEYGLKDPTYTIELKDVNGKKKTILIGGPTGDDGVTWYVMEKGEKIVYIVGYDIIDCIDSLDIQRSQSERMMETGEGIIEEE